MRQLVSMSKGRGEKEEKRKDVEFSNFLSQTTHSISKISKDTNKTTFKGQRFIASSPLSSIGVVDSFGMTEEAKNWLRENEFHSSADKAFMSHKAPNKSKRQWNDSSILDNDFAADEEIVDNRQLSANKPFVPQSSTFR